MSSRRSAQRRIEVALARLNGDEGDEPVLDGPEAVAVAVERAVAAAAGRLNRAEQLVEMLGSALDRVEEAVVICDGTGAEVYRNRRAGASNEGGLGDVLAEQAIAGRLADAVAGDDSEQLLELFTPTRRNLRVRSYPLGSPPGSAGAMAVVEDTSERHRLDDIRRDFVANVSHELKTPVGALSLLAETLDGEDDPDIITRLSGRVGLEAARLGRIIDDLLDLSRIEANDGPPERVTLRLILGQAVEPLRAVAAGRDIDLETLDVPPELAVSGQRRDLVSAVGNLVDNAIKYSEPGSCVRVDAHRDGDWVELSVSDRGIGIPRRDIERIFERFYRVDRARSRLTGGTGLGLSIVRHVVANHGGTVRVASAEGEGSTFTLRLPIALSGVARRPTRPLSDDDPDAPGCGGH